MKILILLGIGLFCQFSFAQTNFTPEKLWELNRIGGGDVSPDHKNILYTSTSYNMEKNRGNTDLYIYNLQDKKSIQLTNTAFSEFEAKWFNNQEVVFLSTEKEGVQLWKISIDGSQKTQLSNLENGLEGYVISPALDKIITLESIKTTQTIVDIYPDLPQANARIENDLMYRHWNQWEDEFKTHLFLRDFSNSGVANTGIDLLQNEPYDAVVPPFNGSETVTFSNDGKFVYYSSKKMLGKAFAVSTNSDLYQYDIATGKTMNFTEGMMGYDNLASFSTNGQKMAWLSMAKNGFEADKNRLFIHDFKKGVKTQLNLTIDVTIGDFKWSLDGKSIYFTAPYRGIEQLFSVDVEKNVTTQITDGKMNVVSFSLSGETIILGLQSMLSPTDLYSFVIKTKKLENLTHANQAELASVSIPSVQERWIKTSDGKEMLTWVVLPPNFDATKKYPTLLYCQGGPQSMVSQFFSYRWNLMLMASQGYIVVAPNRRGLPGFGQEWNDAISKDWGGQPMRDYLAAIDEVSKESYVDKDKMGAIGASYGGYSVYYLAGIHENRFKTFVAHCGLFNLESWYGTTEELFFANYDIGGPYWDPANKALYEKNSPHNLVQNWNTPIMVIHGGMDFRVPESEGMQAFQAAQLKGLKSRYLYFPTEGHWVQKPQNGLLWQREFFKWLAEDLK
ncbi:MAG: S9 family peptidase [Crocinitomicaceae bacterium]